MNKYKDSSVPHWQTFIMQRNKGQNKLFSMTDVKHLTLLQSVIWRHQGEIVLNTA